MNNEFRELERPQAVRKKDVVLMATVTSFESLPHPSRSELRQFAELFTPLFTASSEEARREAVAALSQCPNVPPAVAFFIASQPIAIAAPFLISSHCLSDDTLIAIARTQGEAHARAIVRREALSPRVIDALVGLRHDRGIKPDADPAPASPQPAENASSEAERVAREEDMRKRLRMLAGHITRPASDRLGLRSLSAVQQALLVRFARNRENGLFASVLADALSASRWLSERIMLDISGQQLATTLKGLGMDTEDALFILQRIYDHLSGTEAGMSRAERLWNRLDEDQCGQRVEAWRRADSYTYSEPVAAPPAEAGSAQQDIEETAAPLRTTASVRQPGRYSIRRSA
ncbi:DUF2336 domain-containing protein [Rhizobium sp. NTR19]|uniref:DUF2336 domain-containing protein n=1 Tax=Neorhizobium turbinariae TaxID=2937795 RepID=A0ABT0IRF0_9HYPH|nr:DUF2336 domain-containing protein [Neorhizobium turbinariae]MCK8780451.1 DUF2336 domain-containing protein [Neorhizobium turbinariae]